MDPRNFRVIALRGKGQHQYRIGINQALHTSLDSRLIVLSSQRLDQGFLSIVQETED